MKETKNELSYDATSLDWQALEKSMQIAYNLLLNEIKISSLKMQNALYYEGAANYIEAARMASSAKQLVIVAETLHTVQGANCRRKLEIVNKATELAFDEEEKTQ
jgi:hypothetical protein